MRILMESYDDNLTLVTQHGTKIHIEVSEIKTRLGKAGYTDQFRISTSDPVVCEEDERRIPSREITIGDDHFPKDEKETV